MWKQYKRKGIAEMRSYKLGEDLSGISVSDVDKPETDMGMIACNPKNHDDQWYVARKYFEENFEIMEIVDGCDCASARFVAHIEDHLALDESVICKICGKTLSEIVYS